MQTVQTYPSGIIPMNNRTFNMMYRHSSGRNTARAAVGREFPTCTLSVVQRVPSSTVAHVSVSPPLIPDGRISRVRLAAAACPQRTFPDSPRVKRSLVYAPGMASYTSGSTPTPVITVSLALRPDGVLADARHLPRALYLRVGVTRLRGVSSTPSEGIAPPSLLLRAHASHQIPLAD